MTRISPGVRPAVDTKPTCRHVKSKRSVNVGLLLVAEVCVEGVLMEKIQA